MYLGLYAWVNKNIGVNIFAIGTKKTPKYIDGEYNERWAGQSYLVSDPKVEIYPASETGDFIAVFYDDKLVGKYRSIGDAKDKVEIWKKTGTWPKSTYGGPVTDTSGRPVTGVGGRYPRRRRWKGGLVKWIRL